MNQQLLKREYESKYDAKVPGDAGVNHTYMPSPPSRPKRIDRIDDRIQVRLIIIRLICHW